MLTKIHHALIDGLSGAEIMGVLLDLSPEGREAPPETEEDGAAEKPGDLEMMARGLLGVPRYPVRLLRSLPSALPNLDQTSFGAIPGAGTVAKVTDRLRRTVSSGEGQELERSNLRAPRTSFNGRVSPHRRFVFGQIPLDDVKEVKDRARGDGQRRRRHDLRRRGAPVADRARRAARRAAGGAGAGVGAQRGGDGHLRQPHHAHARAAVHRHRGPARAPDGPARGAAGDEGAPPRDAGQRAPGHQPLHPAGGVLARRAGHVRAQHLVARAGPPGTWSSPTCPGPSSRSTAPARGWRPTTRCRWSPTAWA